MEIDVTEVFKRDDIENEVEVLELEDESSESSLLDNDSSVS